LKKVGLNIQSLFYFGIKETTIALLLAYKTWLLKTKE
jgi:hypothetical protein